MTRPPTSIIAHAECVARKSPCAKSKRGAVAYRTDARGCNQIISSGFNGQPAPFFCTGTERCRELCGKICEHAEARAIRNATGTTFVMSGRAESDPLDLVHVKIGEDGKLVAGGPPSCLQCSRAILDCGFIAGVWLYEGIAAVLRAMPRDPGAWHRYTAEEFHRATLRNCDMEL